MPGAPFSTQPLNPHWAQAPSAWPAVATGADAPPTLYDPGTAMTSAFDGPLTTLPASLHPGGLGAPTKGTAATATGNPRRGGGGSGASPRDDRRHPRPAPRHSLHSPLE